jgi:peptidoglycan/xylan/chitin deacetylase (PgdA/CDA1 family)
MMLPARIPRWFDNLYPRRIWRIPPSGGKLYLTFDDGPHPEITTAVLDILKRYQAKATFFCIGDRVMRYPAVYERILHDGHAVGNHTFRHLHGRKYANEEYISDIQEAAACIDSKLFRPPYGRLRAAQQVAVNVMGMTTIMWTVLSGDYDVNMQKEECASRVLGQIKDGDIILFHDSEKAATRMLYALERLLDKGLSEGFIFEAIRI